MGSRAYFVVNPRSANGRTGKAWPEIKELAQRAFGEIEAGFTERRWHACELARAALKAGHELIVSVGGDGTNNEVVNGFFEGGKPVNPEAVFAVVCSGTGSDLIKTLQIPRDFRESVPMLPGLAAKPTDVGRMTLRDHSGRDVSRYFINIASFGVGGEVDERVNRTSKALGGKASFLWASFWGSLAYKNKAVTFRVDGGEPFERKIFLAAASNGQYFGAGMRVAPDAAVDDGLLDFAVLGDFSFFEQFKLMSTIYKGGHLGLPKVEIQRARRVEATSSERVLLDVDGEQPGTLPATFEVLPCALRVKRP
ncbi:MAG TPA: diacylglycerol kinase family protein [bacterium]|nr:diacylglycerol kinase family protein [bacterium]